MFTVKSLLLTPDHDQRKPRPSILNISSLLCSEPEFSSNNQDISYFEKCQQQENNIRESPKENIWKYQSSQYHHQPMFGEYYNNSDVSNLRDQRHRSTSISSISSSICSPLSSKSGSGDEDESATIHRPLKTKRRRTSSQQLAILNNVFERTFFPSTQVRMELARQLGMSPRTVQIWFQNKRQAMRSKQRGSKTNTSRESSVFE